jgi:hypothetical protein
MLVNCCILTVLVSGGSWAGVIVAIPRLYRWLNLDQWLERIQLGIEDVNKKGMAVKGEKYTIEIVRYDSVCQPVDGANTRKLIGR